MKELSTRALKVKPSSTLKINSMAKDLKAKGVDVINFCAGEPDFDTPDNIKAAAVKAINDGFTKYTDTPGTVELRKAICDKLKKDNGLDYVPSQIVVSNGAKQCLHNVFSAVLSVGDEVILPAPYWLSYSEMIQLVGGIPVYIQTKGEDGFGLTRELLEKVLSNKTKAILINSPNNPTGIVYSEEELKLVADFAVKNDLYVISDEIYEPLIYDEDAKHISIASFGKEIYDRTIVINGLSKSYAMTGWRIGYSASNKAIASAISSIQSHQSSNINSMSQKAAVEALKGDQSQMKVMVGEFKKRRDYMVDRIGNSQYLTAVTPKGAFYVFVNITKLLGNTIDGRVIQNEIELAEEILSKANVAVVPCTDFGLDNHIRLTYSMSVDVIKEGMDRIESFISKYYK